jgi:transcriptional regulator with XRE-family HTH domain
MEQNKTQNELAEAAGISRSTLSLLERIRPSNPILDQEGFVHILGQEGL